MGLRVARRPRRRSELRRAFRWLTLAVCLAVLAAGCGGASKAHATTHPAATATPPPPTATPVPAQLGKTLSPGTPLPSEATCAKAVPSSPWEPRPSNKVPNHSVPTATEIAGLIPWDAAHRYDPRADALRAKITGNYTGTTDMIIQWAACVWGFDPDILRAQAALESSWFQLIAGDPTTDFSQCPPNPSTKGSLCYETYGLSQVKWEYNKSAWPMVRDDTAFNIEYVFGLIRSCYEGYDTWLGNGYKAGDLWGCIGFWYSGDWHDSGANYYISVVQGILAGHRWTLPGF